MTPHAPWKPRKGDVLITDGGSAWVVLWTAPDGSGAYDDEGLVVHCRHVKSEAEADLFYDGRGNWSWLTTEAPVEISEAA